MRDFGSIRKLPRGRYQARYVGPDGRRHQAHATFPRKGMAQGWLAAEDDLITRGRWTPPSTRDPNKIATAPKLREYAEQRIKARERRSRKPLRPRTAEGYPRLIDGPLAPLLDVRVDHITPVTVQRWYSSLPDLPTQNARAYALLSSLINDAADEELIDHSPCRLKGAGKPEPHRRGETLTAAELVDYLHQADPYYVTALELTALCSLRSSEIRGLRRCDVADDASVIHIEQAVTRIEHKSERTGYVIDAPKTSAGRRSTAVPASLQPMLVAVLEAHAEQGREWTGLLFPARDGQTPMHDSVLYKAHKRAARAIGRGTLTLHDLRRTGATLAAQSGATTREIMRRLAHTRPDVAMIYQVADDARDRMVADSMPAISWE